MPRELHCPACNFENREEAKYCQECGERLEKICRVCGNSIPASLKFCVVCGTALEMAPPTPKDTRKAGEGERKYVTVLFADVVDYTALCEKLDPEQIKKLLSGCLAIQKTCIERHGGNIVQFMGDGIMALFGAPIAQEDHAQRACYAALDIQAAMARYGQELKKASRSPLLLRIGINTGLVLVGSIGETDGAYTAIGDTTNLASRMEAMAPPNSVLVSGETFRIVKDFFVAQRVGPVRVKGKEGEIDAYQLVTVSHIGSRIEAAIARGLTPFVGREKEVALLDSAFGQASKGSGQIIGIVGEAGVGKSRILLEFGRVTRMRESTFLEGTCIPVGTTIAYLPVIAILKSLFQIKDDMPEPVIKERIREKLKSLDAVASQNLPPLYELFSLPTENQEYQRLEPNHRRKMIFGAIREVLFRESGARPLVIAIDNLSWIDKTSEEFLTELIAGLAPERILLVLLYRPEYVHPWSDKPHFTEVRLGPLPFYAGPQMVTALLQGSTVSPELINYILDKAAGNPLFIEELTLNLIENGYITKTGGTYGLSPEVLNVPAPDTIQGIIAARIDRLDEDVRQTLRFASVIGKTFNFSILENIAEPGAKLAQVLQELQRLDLIYEKTLAPELEYEFKHDLVQEVAYSALLLEKRKELHGATAEAIERIYGERKEEYSELLAHHYSKSDSGDKAHYYLKLSGLRSIGKSSLWEAFRFYRQAIHILKDQPEMAENVRSQLDLCLLAASPMISLGFPEDSLDILRNGERLARNMGHHEILTTICSIIGLFYAVKGDPILGIQYSTGCLALARERNNIDLMAPVVFDLCTNYSVTGQFSKVVQTAPEILAMLENAGKEKECYDRGYNIYSALSAFYGFSMGYLGEYEKAREVLLRGLQVARSCNNLYSLGLTETVLGYIHCHRGEAQEALAHFTESIRYLEQGQVFVLLGVAWSGVGYARYYLGEIEEARSDIQKGLRIHTEAGISYNLSVHHWFLSLLSLEQGDTASALTSVQTSLKLAQRYNERYFQALGLVLLGRILLRTTHPELERAEAAMLEGLKILQELQTRPQIAITYLCLAELYRQSGDNEKAMKSLKTAAVMFEEMKMPYWLGKIEQLAGPKYGER